jgi:S-adenosylmethionine uptake transporter
MLFQGKKAFITHRWSLHLLRGLLIFAAIGLWSQGMKTAPITTATMMSFSVPLFVLVLARLLLREHVAWPLWVATLLGFVGIVFILGPSDDTFREGSGLFLLGAILFGLLDVLNKKYVTHEPMLCMLFYATLVALLCVLYPALQAWRRPTLPELAGFVALGIGNNLILYFLLRAFALAGAASLAPFRYLELFISMTVGYIFFNEIPAIRGYLGAAFIIPSTLFIGYYQMRYNNRLNKS